MRSDDLQPQKPPSIKSEQPLFPKKTVEMPLLDHSLKMRLETGASTTNSSMSNFYQQNKVYFWAIILGVTIIGVLSYFAFHKTPAPSVQAAQVNIAINAPDTVASGGEEVYKITISNNDKNNLTALQLELVYPTGVSYISSTPQAQNLSGTLFAAPDLISGQNVVIIVKAKVVGNINDRKHLIARLHYKYSNFNSEFTKEQSSDVQLVASDVALNFSGPTTVPNAQVAQFTVTYQNNSDADIKNARVQLTFPTGFKFASATPPPDLGTNTWNVNSLPKGSQGTIQVQGVFDSSNPGESKTTTADFLILGDNGAYFTQSTAQVITAIASLPLIISQQLDQVNALNVVNPGDTLRFVLKYQNNSSVAATGVSIITTLDPKVLDLNTLTAEGAQISGSTILWNASSIAQLASLAPNESGTVVFSVAIKKPATKDSSTNVTVGSHVKIKSNEYETTFPGNDLEFKVSSPVEMTTNLDYSTGAIPPNVGKATSYKVSWNITNATDALSNTIVTAFIPLGPGGFDATSLTPKESGKVNYDPSTGKITWNIGALPAHTGQFSPARQLQFIVTINPSASQANQSPLLVKNIALQGTDTFTNQTIHSAADDITTNDVSGQFNGQGQVQ